MSKKVVAIVPARGGSKEIPLKNIRKFAGMPLLYWVVRAAQGTECVDEVVVATDSEEISCIVKSFDFSKVVVYRRSDESARDQSPSEEVLIEYARRNECKDVIFLQATTPFTTAFDIDAAYDKFLSCGCDSLLSVVPQKRFIWEPITDGVRALNYDYRHRPRRQDMSAEYVENGGIYIISRDNLLKYNNRLCGVVGVYEMCQDSFFELDSMKDWGIAERLFRCSKVEEIRNSIAKNISVLGVDVDGVLTNGQVLYTEEGECSVNFNRLDGKGFSLFDENGRDIVVISAENSPLVRQRLEKVGCCKYYLGVKDKKRCFEEYLTKVGKTFSDAAFIGDDVQDVEVMKSVTFSACPSSAIDSVKGVADYICEKQGGDGVVREVVDVLLNKE